MTGLQNLLVLHNFSYRFLEGVPHVLNAIKDVHAAAISGDMDEFVKKSSHPVPIEILGSKDLNGLSPLHKVES